MTATTAIVPSIIDDQLAGLEEVVAESPAAAVKLAASIGLHGWPERAYRESRGGRALWVHEYIRRAAA